MGTFLQGSVERVSYCLTIHRLLLYINVNFKIMLMVKVHFRLPSGEIKT
ncbi:MAG: hypothetical protein ACI9CD_001250, partial [Candidatus Deianiraeaceae bacterium]